MLATSQTASSKKSSNATRSKAAALQKRSPKKTTEQHTQETKPLANNVAAKPVTATTVSPIPPVKPIAAAKLIKPVQPTKPAINTHVAPVMPTASVQAKPVISRAADTHEKKTQQSQESNTKQTPATSTTPAPVVADEIEQANTSAAPSTATQAATIDQAEQAPDTAKKPNTAPDNKKAKESAKQKGEKPKKGEKKKGAKKEEAKDNYPSSPESDPAFKTLKKRVKKTAREQQTTAPAEQESQAAQRAAPVAANERMGSAQESQVAAMDEQEPGEFDAAAFKAKLMERIKAMQLPANQDEASNFEDNNNIQEINDAASQEASQEQANTAGPITQTTATPPNAETAPEREITPLPEPPIGANPASVSANRAMPAPRPASQVSQPLQDNMQELDQQMATNDVTEEQLSNANEPTFTSALGSRSEAQANTEAAPNQFRQQENQTLNSSQQQAKNTSAGELEGMHQGRSTILNTVLGQQTRSGTQNTTERQRVSNEINTIYQTTKTDVEKILTTLDTEVSTKFDAAARKAKQKFEDYVKQKVDAYKDRRYSGIRGAGRWIRDKFKSLPSEVNQFYVDGREVYIKAMDTALTAISNHIALKLTAAKKRIEQGKQNVTTYVGQLDDSLKSFGKDAAENIQTQFDELTDSVNSKQDDLIDSLAQQYNDSLKEVDARIGEMKAANRGLIDRAKDAINGVIETIKKLKQLISTLLSEIQSILPIIMADPIGFAKNLFAGARRGFDSFKANIKKHLIGGFVKWLTGAMGPMGITIPDDLFSLKGIFSLVTQVLGFTWDYLRKKAVKLLGEPVVKTMESGLEMFQIIRSKGFAGIWKYIKDQFTDLKEKIIDSIQQMLITKVIEAGIKWLLSLLIPGAGFIKAAMAIKDFIVFFVESAMMLIPALITAIRALASGNVAMVTKAIENGMALLVPMVINLFAKLIGLGGLVKRVQKIIKRIRKRIDKAINKLIFKAKKAAKKLLKKMKGKGATQGRGADTRTAREKERDVQAALKEGSQLLHKSSMTPKEIKKQLPSIKSRYRLKSAKLKQDKSSKKYYIEVVNSPAKKTDKVELDNPELEAYLGKQILKDNNQNYKGKKHKKLEEMGYKFIEYSSPNSDNSGSIKKLYIRRTTAIDAVHIDDAGILRHGEKKGSKETHKNYTAENFELKEKSGIYTAAYTTKTYDGKAGPTFTVDISFKEVRKKNKDISETRNVTGSDLVFKPEGKPRGEHDSAKGGFHNAHLIGDRFGGPGKNHALNIYPSSPKYNTETMAEIENMMAKKVSSEEKYTMNVNAEISKEETGSSNLSNFLKQEFKKDNKGAEQSSNTVKEALVKKLQKEINKDLNVLPGQFKKVVYNVKPLNFTKKINKDKYYADTVKKFEETM